MPPLRRVLSPAASIALLIGVVLFATRPANQAAVAVHYIFGEASWPLWQLVGGAFLAGALAAWFLAVPPWMRARLDVRRHRKQSERLETELHQLRNLPLSSDEQATTNVALSGSAGDSQVTNAAVALLPTIGGTASTVVNHVLRRVN